VVALLVQDISDEKFQRLQMLQDGVEELWGLVFEKVDFLDDLSMSALNDLTSE